MAEYVVESQESDEQMLPGGRFERVWHVHYRDLTTNTRDTVTIAATLYNAENVDIAIRDRLQHIRDIAGLGNPIG